ncbi:MAG: PhoH family protein [Syntrophomonadaceae bacterium]|nr:PhoH family protein [Syntrophomonadaceae bacterium]
MTEKERKIDLDSNRMAAIFFGTNDENFKVLKEAVDVELAARGTEIFVRGEEALVNEACELIHSLIHVVEKEGSLGAHDIMYMKELHSKGKSPQYKELLTGTVLSTWKGKVIKAKTLGQQRYVQSILRHDVVFSIGPAGTGKTYLAVVMAVRALRNREVERIVLVRPAVEAGEKLGFLPGDFVEKVNPYLRPLYDGLFDVLGVEATQRYLDKNIIEIAPLAYMRGRTLNDAFIILDEAQNTTPVQMKMFLTRLGFGSKAVITGDVTQVDLPKEEYSGLVEIQKILRQVDGIGFEYLSQNDVVRHPLVQSIINAYEMYDGAKP